jgi:hypothetical protein
MMEISIMTVPMKENVILSKAKDLVATARSFALLGMTA